MNKKLFPVTAALLVALVGSSTVYGARSSRENKAAETVQTVKVIKIGMSSDEVRQQLGRPAEVGPMDAPDGQAEVWVYRRPLGKFTRQAAPTTHRTPSYWAPGACEHKGMMEDAVYENETIAVEEVTQLLFFNGKLLCSKRAKTQERY